MSTARVLACSGVLELLASCVLGVGILALMQPWGSDWARRGPKLHDLGRMHLDLLMLALVQVMTALLVRGFELLLDSTLAALLIAGSWLNPVPYLVRGLGLNAFVWAGRPAQKFWAGLGLASVVALMVALAGLLGALLRAA